MRKGFFAVFAVLVVLGVDLLILLLSRANLYKSLRVNKEEIVKDIKRERKKELRGIGFLTLMSCSLSEILFDFLLLCISASLVILLIYLL